MLRKARAMAASRQTRAVFLDMVQRNAFRCSSELDSRTSDTRDLRLGEATHEKWERILADAFLIASIAISTLALQERT